MEQVRQISRTLYLLYHELRPGDCQYSYVMDTGVFRQHAELFAQLQKGDRPGLRPEITFDDGHISNVEFAAPILQSLGLTAHFFITVGWTGTKQGYMGWPELRRLHESGHVIGAHGWTHTLLTHCSDRDLRDELSTARLTLEDRLGNSINTMSLPGGRYNRRVLTACEEAGYTRVFSSIPRAESEPASFLVGRLNIRREMSLGHMSSLFQPDSNALSSLGTQYRLKAGAKALLGDRLYERLWGVVNRREANADPGEAAANENSARHQ
jgi:Polysaccharide deacetylase